MLLHPPNQQTVVGKMEAQSEHAHAFVFPHLAPTCMLSRCLVTKKKFCIGAQEEVY